MEQSFSQRMGLKPVRNTIQVDSMDEELKKGLWNDVHQNFWWRSNWGVFRRLIYDLWTNFFMKLIDEAPNYETLLQTTIKELYFSLKWYEVYDFIEFVAHNFEMASYADGFVNDCNITLKKHLSAYRFVGKKLVPVTSDQEIAEIEEALRTARQFTPHLDRALELLDRKAPDYANSIKESISVVEATCKLITGDSKATLGKALDKLEKSQKVELHEKLKTAFQNLYGYTSDAQGIRHGFVGKADLDVEDARFMLIACSAFINYLAAKADKAGIKLPDK